MNAYQKALAIIPLQAAKLAGLTIRGYRGIDGRSGAIEAMSVTYRGEKVTAYVTCRDRVSVQWADPDAEADYLPNNAVVFDLKINDDGEFQLVPPGEGQAAGDSQPVWQ